MSLKSVPRKERFYDNSCITLESFQIALFLNTKIIFKYQKNRSKANQLNMESEMPGNRRAFTISLQFLLKDGILFQINRGNDYVFFPRISSHVISLTATYFCV